MRRISGAALATALVLTGCGAGDDPAIREPAASPSGLALTQRCENPVEGYALSFPADWFVAEDEGIEPCTFFDVEPLELEPASEATGVAIRVDVRDVPLPQARQDSLSEGDKTAEDRQVGDRAALRVTGTLTEEVLLPAGTRITTWLVELDGRTFTIHADDHSAQDYAAAVEVLDAMAASLEVL